MSNDIETFRSLLRDERLWVSLGIIKRLDLAADKSVLRVEVAILPEQRNIVARMTWEDVGSGTGMFCFPEPNDLVLLAMPEGDEEQAYVVKRLTSKLDKIPVQAVDGSTAIISRSGKKLWLGSNTRVNLARGEATPSEALVLGEIFKTFAESFLDIFAQHTHTGNAGFPTSVPLNVSEATAIKASPISDRMILSDLAFTEK